MTPPTAYELAVIIREGARRMMEEQENVYYYLTVMNGSLRTKRHAQGQGCEEGIMRGHVSAWNGQPSLPKLHVQVAWAAATIFA